MQVLHYIGKFIHNPFYFKLTAIVVYIFYNVPSDFNIENIPMKIIFAWGAYLIAKDFFTKRIMFKQKFWYILLALVVSFAISVVLNVQYQFPYNLYNWVYLMHTVFLIYPFNHNYSFDRVKREMVLFNDVFIWLLTILVTISLLLYVFNIQYWVLSGTGTHWLRQGFMEGRLFGVFTSPNFGSILGYLSVAMSLFNNELKRKDWKNFQPLYLYNIVVQYLYYVLGSSRGAMLTLLAAVAFGFLYLLYRIIRNSQRKGLNLAKATVFTLVGLFVFSAVTTASQEALAYVPTIPQMISQRIDSLGESQVDQAAGPGQEESEEITPVAIQHSDPDAEISAGRFTIWKAGISSTLQRPLFGLSDADLYRDTQPYEAPDQVDLSALDQMDRFELDRAQGNMHNAYVSVFVFSGIVGSLIFLVFAICIGVYHLRSLVHRGFDWCHSTNRLYGLIFLLLATLLVTNLVETHIIFANRNSIGFVFWIYLGYLNYLKPYLSFQGESPSRSHYQVKPSRKGEST